jgi:hypothetical protein
MDQIQGFLENLKQGGIQTHLNLTVIPLLSPDTAEPDYVTLEEALSQGAVEITEVSQSGHVPELKLINQSANKVLVVDGEELVGAKQNRIVNASFLIAGNSEIIMPVSCVGQGRWSYRSRKFASGEKVMPAMLRVDLQRDVSFCLSRGEGYHSDQGKIWDEIAKKSTRMGVRSSTGAMADLFEGQKDRLSEYQRAFSLVECQVGAIFALNGEVAGLECFGHSRIFEKFFKKLIRSYALDALDWLDWDVESWLTGHTDAIRIVRIADIRSLRETGNEYSKKLQGMAERVHDPKIIETRSLLSAFLAKLKEKETETIKRASGLWQTKIRTEGDIEPILTEVESLISAFENLPKDVDDLHIMRRALRIYQRDYKRLSDETLSWDEFETLVGETLKEITDTISDDESPWAPDQIIDAFVQDISKRRKEISKAWIESIEGYFEKISSFPINEVNRFYSRVNTPPPLSQSRILNVPRF